MSKIETFFTSPIQKKKAFKDNQFSFCTKLSMRLLINGLDFLMQYCLIEFLSNVCKCLTLKWEVKRESNNILQKETWPTSVCMSSAKIARTNLVRNGYFNTNGHLLTYSRERNIYVYIQMRCEKKLMLWHWWRFQQFELSLYGSPQSTYAWTVSS